MCSISPRPIDIHDQEGVSRKGMITVASFFQVISLLNTWLCARRNWDMIILNHGFSSGYKILV